MGISNRRRPTRRLPFHIQPSLTAGMAAAFSIARQAMQKPVSLRHTASHRTAAHKFTSVNDINKVAVSHVSQREISSEEVKFTGSMPAAVSAAALGLAASPLSVDAYVLTPSLKNAMLSLLAGGPV